MLISTFSLFFSLALKFASAGGQQEDEVNNLMMNINEMLKVGQLESAIYTFSDLYQLHSTVDHLPRGQIWITSFISFFDLRYVESLVASFLSQEQRSVLVSLIDEIDSHMDEEAFLLDFSTARDRHLRTKNKVELFFRRQIRSLISRRLDPAPLIKAFVSGSGFCSIFKHPTDATNDLNLSNSNEVKLSTLGSLIANMQRRNIDSLWPTLEYPDLFQALRRMSVVCGSFVKYPLDASNRKLFISSILYDLSRSGTFRTYEGPYIVGSSRDVCSQLILCIEDTREILDLYIQDPNTKSLFLDECIDDLPKIFSNNLSKLGWNIFSGSLIERWMNRIEQYLQKSLNLNPRDNKKLYDPLLLAMENSNLSISRARPTPFTLFSLMTNKILKSVDIIENGQFDKYIRALVDEVPAYKAQLAYERGEGLCSLFSMQEMMNIKVITATLVNYGQGKSYKMRGELVGDNQDVKGFVRFSLLRLTCQSLREKSILSNKKRKFDKIIL